MAVGLSELYDTPRKAGAPETRRAAAECVAGYDAHFAKIESDLKVAKRIRRLVQALRRFGRRVRSQHEASAAIAALDLALVVAQRVPHTRMPQRAAAAVAADSRLIDGDGFGRLHAKLRAG